MFYIVNYTNKIIGFSLSTRAIYIHIKCRLSEIFTLLLFSKLLKFTTVCKMTDEILSRDECKIILKRYSNGANYELIDFSLRPLSDNVEGFLGDHMWLTIQYKEGYEEHSKTFFVKGEPVQFEMQVEFCTLVNAFNNEIFFYEQLIPEFKKYYASFDDSLFSNFYFSKEHSIVIENLEESGYKIVDTNDILDMNHIYILLQAFAKLHAASVIYEERKSEKLGRQYCVMDDFKPYLKETFFQKKRNNLVFTWTKTSEICIQSIIDLMPEFDDISKETFKNKFEDYAERCFELAQPSDGFRNVVCHADLWWKNVMFKYQSGKPVHCKMLDFQLMKYGPPMYDVLKCIYQVTTDEMRHHHFDDIIKYYYHYLTKELKFGNINIENVIPYKDIILSVKKLLPYILIEASYYYTFLRAPPEYLKEVQEDKEAYKDYVFRDRSEIVKRYYKPNTNFKKWMDEILLEIKDYASHNEFSRVECRTLVKNKLNTTNYELINYKVSTFGEQNRLKIDVVIKRKGLEEKLHFVC